MSGRGRRDVLGRLVVHRPGGFTLDLELELRAGETTALLGPNGAGKSTALQALAGLVRLDEGALRIGERVVDDVDAGIFVSAPDRHVGAVFQDGLLFEHLTVAGNVAFGPRSRGASRAEARRSAASWLERLELTELAGRRPRELSGGQAQRVALCRALATQPRLLLLDEPLSALDVQSRAFLRRSLAAHLATLDVPRLLVTHDPVEAFLLADRIAVVERGSLTQVAAPDEIRQRPRTAYAADLAGTNLLRGTARSGRVTVGGYTLRVADTAVEGSVLVTIHPHAIALSLDRPHGSPRNTWPAVIDRMEPLGDRTRVSVRHPIPLTAEVTPGAVAELGLDPGTSVWLAIKATEIAVTPGP